MVSRRRARARRKPHVLSAAAAENNTALQRPSVPPGYRPPSSSGQPAAAMFYATAGQQATQPTSARGASYGAGRAPPGFGSRAGMSRWSDRPIVRGWAPAGCRPLSCLAFLHA